MSEAPRKMRGSLLERAAEVYDFDAHLRARTGALPEAAPVPVEHLQPELVAPAPMRTAAAPRPMPRVRLDGPVLEVDRTMLSEGGMLVPGAAVGALAEEFRLVKRQLLLTARSVSGDRARTILVCSANQNEGKTYCAINLAISLAAERDREILLVDADFAKPDVLARLGGSEGPGLLDALADPTIDAESCIVATDIAHLSLLPAGTKSNTDTEMLASDRTAELIADLLAADPRRIILFDSPPALAASPAAVLAGQVGQVMLVVRADSTGESDLRQAVTLLDGCDHIQLLLNAVAFAPGGRKLGTYYGMEDAE